MRRYRVSKVAKPGKAALDAVYMTAFEVWFCDKRWCWVSHWDWLRGGAAEVVAATALFATFQCAHVVYYVRGCRGIRYERVSVQSRSQGTETGAGGSERGNGSSAVEVRGSRRGEALTKVNLREEGLSACLHRTKTGGGDERVVGADVGSKQNKNRNREAGAGRGWD